MNSDNMNPTPPHEDINWLLDIIRGSGRKYDLEKIKKAYEVADRLHEGQRRASGEAYISHPIAVAEIVASLGLDTDSICAALLHDTVEDCADKISLEEESKMFGSDVAMLVDGLTKIMNIEFADEEEAHMEDLRKMLLATVHDVRVIVIKLCDRLHNMRTLSAKKEDRRRAKALETMHIYAPLAHLLGIQKLKQELENLSLYHLDPYGYNEIQDYISKKYGECMDLIEKVRSHVQEELERAGIKFHLESRIKSVYSIYKKMYNKGKSFDEIYDFFALRIICDEPADCYSALGFIHEMYKLVPGRFKDYISTPKQNNYQSIHTTVIGEDGIPFEVQIRSAEMHQIAEYGVAAHWKYKTGDKTGEQVDKRLEKIASFIEDEAGTRDPEDFLDTFKTGIIQEEILVFTPKGDVVSLPVGSNVIDFAYSIHSAVGNKMVGAKINGMIVSIDKVPQNGDIVEIITSNSSKGPSRDWLKIVRTGEAKSKIRQWFKKEKRDENITVGKGIIDAELKKYSRAYTDAQRAEIVMNVAKRIGVQSAEDLYNTIGYGGLSVSKIALKLHDEFARIVKVEEPEAAPAQIPVVKPHKHLKSNSGIIVDGEVGCQIKFAKCCNPLPGDSVIGFVTKGFGISIHKQDCPNVETGMANPENDGRWVRAEWEADYAISSDVYEALLQIFAYNSLTLMADITMTLADMKVSVLSINTQQKGDDKIIINMKISCKNIDHFKSIVSRLRGLHDIEDVTRGFS
ncbi:MAG: bifunctional (p)ppGpp synthetase/guanosine-3',5'-bis(diphosphate) 3'-pyrophosphohydrolase [Clostridia bacterium]|nr:bifunctional (p)ppGpp synthetase/guanosine-3',5'-bis(diphosphate) 3'-pyrophosphohydrolase [Clostridia bacterium]